MRNFFVWSFGARKETLISELSSTVFCDGGQFFVSFFSINFLFFVREV